MSRILLALAALSLFACTKPTQTPPAPAPAPAPAVKAPILDAAQRALFQPLPAHFGEATEAQILLGRTLFHDKRLSVGGEVSCNSCHTLTAFGVDGKSFSTGIKGQLGGRNSPTVWNAAGHFVQFWDGRSPDVEDQAKGPVLNPVEMGMASADDAVEVLRSIPGYLPLFTKAFPNERVAITWDTYGKAVGAFERQLVTPSRFDRWAKGDDTALTEDEQRGAYAFIATGCMSCHLGPLLGGGTYQKVGQVKAWPNTADRGRKDHTKVDTDDMMFKVPSLRNIEKTGPYFHDGSTATLEEAVTLMGRHQLGREIPKDDVNSIVLFLKTLTGTLPPALCEEPAMPADGPRTKALVSGKATPKRALP